MQETLRNFLDLYLYHVGQSETPKRFHYWSALSVLAAAVSDRVWLKVSEAKYVYPNLYVFLIGPSGCGKGASIDIAMRLIEGYEVMNLYAGMATKQAFIDFLAKDGQRDPSGFKVAVQPNAYFVTEELAMSLPQGELAYGLLTFMTGIFMRPSQPITEGTRGKGYTQLVRPTTNWLAGSNEAWLVESVPKSAMESGFLARVCLVQAKRDHAVRYARIVLPPDYAEAFERLRSWVAAYTWVAGEYTLTSEAVALHDEWYMSRPAPEDKSLEPSFFRSDEMVYKLSLLFALADWEGDFDVNGQCQAHEPVVTSAHMQEAIEAWTDLVYDIGGVVDMAATTPQTADVQAVKDLLQRFQRIDRSNLMRKASNRGLNRERLDKALATLFESELVRTEHESLDSTHTRRWYQWTS